MAPATAIMIIVTATTRIITELSGTFEFAVVVGEVGVWVAIDEEVGVWLGVGIGAEVWPGAGVLSRSGSGVG
jgi:hypothetical protein